MIAKARGSSRRPSEPLEVRLSVSFRFGDEAGDRITMMNDRRVPLVGSVFDSRDAIVRGFARLVLQAALRQPRVAMEVLPMLRLLPLAPVRRGARKRR